jgi:hypothetical protein
MLDASLSDNCRLLTANCGLALGGVEDCVDAEGAELLKLHYSASSLVQRLSGSAI